MKIGLMSVLLAIGLTVNAAIVWAGLSQDIFYDDFRNSPNPWAKGKNANYVLDIRDGKYFFEHLNKSGLWFAWTQNLPLDEHADFQIETRIEKISGIQDHGFGLCWGFKDGDNFLVFNISGDGHFQVGKMLGGSWQDTQKWKRSDAIRTGNRALNKLAIQKKANRLHFYINDTFVYETSHMPFLGRKVAFDINNDQKIAIDYLRVAKLQKQANEAPLIVLAEPDLARGGKARVTSKRVRVAGRVSDKDGVYEVLVNGIDANLQKNGTFSAYVPLAIGDNNVSIKATDVKLRSSVKDFSVARETPMVRKEPPPTVRAQRLALVIGNSDYTHGGSLKNPVNDARSMKTILEGLGFDVRVYENSSQKEMKKAIDEFGRTLTQYNVGLFFYAGHGLQVRGHNYLIPVDAKLENENDTEYDTVRADRVLAKMENAGSKTNIVILDACRDNPFERSWRRGAKGTGLAFMNAPSGSLIAYATSPGNTASDGTGRNGLYTSAILKHIKTPNLTIEQMFKRVRSSIMDWSGDQQVPWESTSLRGNFYFKKE